MSLQASKPPSLQALIPGPLATGIGVTVNGSGISH